MTVRGDSVTQQPIPRRLEDGDLHASARTSDWTYIENTATGERELYHRRRDPGHEHDRYGSGEIPPEVRGRLEAAVDRYVSRLGGATAPAAPPDDGIAARLDALGYR